MTFARYFGISDNQFVIVYCIEGCPDMADSCNASTWIVPGTPQYHNLEALYADIHS